MVLIEKDRIGGKPASQSHCQILSEIGEVYSTHRREGENNLFYLEKLPGKCHLKIYE
jgi:hypothetical protein